MANKLAKFVSSVLLFFCLFTSVSLFIYMGDSVLLRDYIKAGVFGLGFLILSLHILRDSDIMHLKEEIRELKKKN